MGLITFLIYLLILVIVFGLIWYVLSMLPLPPPFAKIAQVVVAVVFGLILIVFLLNLAGVGPMVLR